jgi:hypothetical protein
MHFELIPLVEVAKNVAERSGSGKENGGPNNLIFEPASQKTEPYSMPAHSRNRHAEI